MVANGKKKKLRKRALREYQVYIYKKTIAMKTISKKTIVNPFRTAVPFLGKTQSNSE